MISFVNHNFTIIAEFRDSQVYVIVTTEQDQFFVYEYMFLGVRATIDQAFDYPDETLIIINST